MVTNMEIIILQVNSGTSQQNNQAKQLPEASSWRGPPMASDYEPLHYVPFHKVPFFSQDRKKQSCTKSCIVLVIEWTIVTIM